MVWVEEKSPSRLFCCYFFTAGNAIIAAYLYLCYGDAGALRKAMLGSLGALIAFFEILIIIWISKKYFKDYKWP